MLVDKVVYADNTPWPIEADGSGMALQRTSRTAIGNDAANWVAAIATPGAVSSQLVNGCAHPEPMIPSTSPSREHP